MSQNSNILYLNFLKKYGISTFLQDKPNIFYEIKDNKKNNSLKSNINEIKNLDELELLIKRLHKIKFKNYLNEAMIGQGNENAKIFIIGEFPEENNKKIRPFTGESEKLLNKMLKAINLEKKDFYTANVIPWLINKKKDINNKDILECLPFIQRQIEIINPDIILLMGSIAAKAILNSNLEITKLRGKWHQYKSINLNKSIQCLVTYNPMQLIKFPINKKDAWSDLQMLQMEI